MAAIYRSHLESRIADLFGYGDAVLFGRARSGVIALLDVLGSSHETAFVMPSNICPDIFLAVHSTGARVSLAGVDPSNGLPADEAFVQAIKKQTGSGVVMPTHLYGFVQAYPQTLAEARKRGWFVLENDTIATRARRAGMGRTAFGDALVVSFGYAKTLEAGGGGALLTDDAVLAQELRSQERRFLPFNEDAVKAEEAFMLLGRQLRNNRHQEMGSSDQENERLLFERAPRSRYGFPEHLECPLSVALEGLSATVESRRYQVEMWNHFLAPLRDILPEPRVDCIVPWRLIRRAPKFRDQIVVALRNNGIDVGTNFPPLTSSFPVLLAEQRHEGAEQWGREVLNLWLTPEYDAGRMKRVADVIGSIFSQQGESRL